jgi:hypothetical protein
LLVTTADYQLANTARMAAVEVRRTVDKFSPSTIWFQGHWGFQYYAAAQGMTAFDMRYSQIKPGDLMVIPKGNYVSVIPSDMIEPTAAVDATHPRIQTRDLMVIPRVDTGPAIIPSDTIESVATVRELPCRWISTMNMSLRAGFYSDFFWGPLPFAFGSVRPEEYRILRF